MPEDSKQFEVKLPKQYEGLPSEVLEELWIKPEYADPEKNQQEETKRRQVLDAVKAREQNSDQQAANDVRKELGIPEVEVNEGLVNQPALERLWLYYDQKIAKSRDPQRFKKIYDDLFEKIKGENDQAKIAEQLMGFINEEKRVADYQVDPREYQELWELANNDDSLPHKAENSWIYRGNFSTKEKPTATRGSLNIEISEAALRELDGLISQGVIDANYKFGEPGTKADAGERHDAITMYFLEEPSPEALQALSELAAKHFRGNDLIGKKISEGFYMSEVGSIPDQQAVQLLTELENQDPALARAVRGFLTSNNRGRTRVAMSEAQFYSVKETFNLFGKDLKYDQNRGFEVIDLAV